MFNVIALQVWRREFNIISILVSLNEVKYEEKKILRDIEKMRIGN